MNTVNYSYDNLGRLVSITFASNNTQVLFVYDTMGNRVSVTVTCPGGTC